MSGMVAAVTWPDVALALIAALPGIVAAFAALKVRAAVKTPSGAPIGTVAEFTHDTAIANNLHLRDLNGGKQPTDPHIPIRDDEAA